MGPTFVPEEYSRRTEKVRGYSVAIISYRLGSTYYAHAEIDLPGAGARLARAQDRTREGAEATVWAEARRRIEATS